MQVNSSLLKNNISLESYQNTCSNIPGDNFNTKKQFVRDNKEVKSIIEKEYLQKDLSETTPNEKFFPIDNVVCFLPPQKISNSYSITLQKWYGYVVSIEDNKFTAIVSDSLGKLPDARATFSVDEVSEGDRELICEDAFFDWVIEREKNSRGTIENKEYVIFKRLPIWDKSELDKKSAKLDEFNEWLNSGNG